MALVTVFMPNARPENHVFLPLTETVSTLTIVSEHAPLGLQGWSLPVQCGEIGSTDLCNGSDYFRPLLVSSGL